MKKILLFLVIIALSFEAKSQSWTPIFGKQRFASGLGIPVKDSTYFLGTADSALIYINPSNASLYYKYKGAHKKVGNGTGTVTSVGLTAPSAFTVTGSPVTGSGTLALTGAGNTTQYIDGSGALQTFPVLTSAEKLILVVHNNSGATITKGTVVYINGASGNKPTIAKALAAGDATSAQTLGLVQADISNNSNGNVVLVGSIIDLNTSSFSDGQQLYLSGVTAGAYTATKTLAPTHLVYVGVVTRAHPTQGVIEVKIQNGYELDEIHDVAISSKANNDGLFYESSTSLWKNKSIATVLGYTPANESTVVKLTGTQTIDGTKTFSSGIYAPNFVLSGGTGNTGLYYGHTNRVVLANYTSGGIDFETNGGNINMTLFPNGNLGIGTTLTDDGANKLQVSGTGKFTGDLTVNGIKVGRGNGSISDNTAMGVTALGANTIGSGNTAFGYSALNANTTGGNNTAIGNFSIAYNINGDSNTAIGLGSLLSNSSGSFNTGVGKDVLSANTSGQGNVAVGHFSLGSNTTASYNTALGSQSLFYNTNGHNNVAIGRQSLLENSSGNYNTAVGNLAGQYITTGSYNTIIGGYGGYGSLESNVILSDGLGNVCYQYDGLKTIIKGNIIPSFSGGASLGNSSSIWGDVWAYNLRIVDQPTPSNYFIWNAVSDLYLNHSNYGNIAYIDDASGIYVSLSDINKKKDFEESSIGLNAILGLKPTLYRMKSDNTTSAKTLGFIAQEVKDFIPQAYVEKGDGENKFIGLQDRPIIAALVKAVQELSAKNDALEARIKALENK